LTPIIKIRMATSDFPDGVATSGRPAGSTLTVDLDAIGANYRTLRNRTEGAVCAGVVKANAYGLGVELVGQRLWREGCRTFFVASLEEAIHLRGLLQDAEIVTLNGLMLGEEAYYREYGLLPTLNDIGQIETWSAYCGRTGSLPAAVHFDTGMSRLGLSASERRRLSGNPEIIAGIECRYLLSHLACADPPGHPLNDMQRCDFAEVVSWMPHEKASLAASAGIFLGRGWHFDMVRAGMALYGGAPVEGQPNPMIPVVRLEGLVLQVRDVDSSETVGYGATHKITKPTRVATVAAGYADGYLRSLGSRSAARWGNTTLSLIGRVSMDLITLDATAATGLMAGDMVELIGSDYDINALASDAGTIPYEILTSLGRRYRRCYLDDGA
jgi:alanine racemase